MKKCRLCSKLSFGLNKLLSLLGIFVDCSNLDKTTRFTDSRIQDINSAAPSCACEKYSMSYFSPGFVNDNEQLALFIFLPIFHVSKKDGKVKPNAFSHVHHKGRSIQRHDIATSNELGVFVDGFLTQDTERTWKGVLLANCSDIKAIKFPNSNNRTACVYDTAREKNFAHAEIGQSQYVINEEDRNELRHELLKAFNDGVLINSANYKDGVLWDSLVPELRRL